MEDKNVIVETSKVIFGVAAGYGASAIVKNACRAFMPKTGNVMVDLCCTLGAGCLGSIAWDAASERMEKTIDSFAEAIAGIELAIESLKEKEAE